MDIILQQFLSILVAPPGNLIYHLTLAFAVFASLQVALISRRAGTGGLPAGRSLLGLNMLLIAQLALFLSSGLAWQGVVDPHTFLPVFDRAVILISLIWIGWMWAFPNSFPRRRYPHRFAQPGRGYPFFIHLFPMASRRGGSSF